MSNAIKVIVGFEKLCRKKGVVPSLALFRAFFNLKSSGTARWYQIAPRQSKPIRFILPNKVFSWKNAFFYCRIPRNIQLPRFWKPNKVVEGVGPSLPEGFEVLNVSDIIWADLGEVDIPRNGEADYRWVGESGT